MFFVTFNVVSRTDVTAKRVQSLVSQVSFKS